jgi:hypothetical protein
VLAVYRATPCRKAAGVKIGISRNGLSASRSSSPGDDQVGMAVDGQLQKLVVLWIAQTAISSAMGDQLGSRQHFAQPFPIAEGSAARAAADPR